MTAQPAAATDALRGITSMATRHVLAELVAAYASRSGQQVALEAAGGVDVVRRIGSGEAFDFVVLASGAIDQLVAQRHVDPGSRVAIAQSGIAVAVRSGAQKPDVTSEDAVREAVLAARTIGYSSGPSGRHLAQLFARWGIADAVARRAVEAPPGVPVGTLIARGDVELGFQQASELVHVPGVDIVGPLPAPIQLLTVFTAATCVVSSRKEAAKALFAFFASTEATTAKRRHSMEPAASP